MSPVSHIIRVSDRNGGMLSSVTPSFYAKERARKTMGPGPRTGLTQSDSETVGGQRGEELEEPSQQQVSVEDADVQIAAKSTATE